MTAYGSASTRGFSNDTGGQGYASGTYSARGAASDANAPIIKLAYNRGAKDGRQVGIAIGLPRGRALRADDDFADGKKAGLALGLGMIAARNRMGYVKGKIAGAKDGFRRGISSGQARGRAAGVASGEAIGFAAGLHAGIGLGRSIVHFHPDANAPTITFVSPTPGAAPGAAGGFPADPSAAKDTPIVIQLADTNPGLQYVCVGVRYTDEDGNEIEETIYRRDNFRGRYVLGSKQAIVGGALQLTIKRSGGWLALIQGATKEFEFFADAVDAAGNVSA